MQIGLGGGHLLGRGTCVVCRCGQWYFVLVCRPVSDLARRTAQSYLPARRLRSWQLLAGWLPCTYSPAGLASSRRVETPDQQAERGVVSALPPQPACTVCTLEPVKGGVGRAESKEQRGEEGEPDLTASGCPGQARPGGPPHLSASVQSAPPSLPSLVCLSVCLSVQPAIHQGTPPCQCQCACMWCICAQVGVCLFARPKVQLLSLRRRCSSAVLYCGAQRQQLELP